MKKLILFLILIAVVAPFVSSCSKKNIKIDVWSMARESDNSMSFSWSYDSYDSNAETMITVYIVDVLKPDSKLFVFSGIIKGKGSVEQIIPLKSYGCKSFVVSVYVENNNSERFFLKKELVNVLTLNGLNYEPWGYYVPKN